MSEIRGRWAARRVPPHGWVQAGPGRATVVGTAAVTVQVATAWLAIMCLAPMMPGSSLALTRAALEQLLDVLSPLRER